MYIYNMYLRSDILRNDGIRLWLYAYLVTFCWTMDAVGVLLGPGEGRNTPPFSLLGLSSFLLLNAP